MGGTLSLSLSFAEDMLFTTLRYLKFDKKLPGSRSPNKTTATDDSVLVRDHICVRGVLVGWCILILIASFIER